MSTRYPAVEAVAALIRVRRDTIDTDDGPVRVDQPCLLAMLTDGLQASSSGRGAGGGGAGTMPINTAAWDLLVEIRYDAHAWAQLLGVDPKPYAGADAPRPGKPATPPIGRLLRAVAVVASTTARDQVADAITRCARRWAAQIEGMLTGTSEQRAIRGAACTSCGASTVVEDREDPTPGRYRMPAVVLITPPADDDDREPTLCCLACGWHQPIGIAAEVIAGVTVQLVAGSDTPENDHHVDDRHGQAA